MKILLIIFDILIIIVVVVLGSIFYKFSTGNDVNLINNNPEKNLQINIHDGTYKIGEESITLKNGLEIRDIVPGSASKLITKYWGNDLITDLDGNGTEDRAFIITQQTGGTGTFYYVTAMLNTKNGQVTVPGILLGDRISPQNMNLEAGGILDVNYVDRKPGESFVINPSLGKILRLRVDPKSLQFVVAAIK